VGLLCDPALFFMRVSSATSLRSTMEKTNTRTRLEFPMEPHDFLRIAPARDVRRKGCSGSRRSTKHPDLQMSTTLDNSYPANNKPVNAACQHFEPPEMLSI